MTVQKTSFEWALVKEAVSGSDQMHLVPTEPVDHELVGYRCWCLPQEYNMQGVDMILHTPSIAREVVPDYLPCRI